MGSGIGNNRAGLLRNILNFLVPPPGTSSLTLDSDVYSCPAAPSRKWKTGPARLGSIRQSVSPARNTP